MKLEKIPLEGQFVRLEPLSEQHREGLCQAINDGALWQLFVTSVPHPNNIDTFMLTAEQAYNAGDGLCYATIDKNSNQIAGSTRFMQADLPNKRLEIGFTFLGKRWQRTAINTEAKYLMLRHAFETLKVNRVEFLTDYLNTRSRTAILRLGARQEGILRSHKVVKPDGRIRDSVLFSIIQPEWPGIKQLLSEKLGEQ